MRYSRNKIFDKFTALKVSRQRKWQFRHPKADKIIRTRFLSSVKGRVYKREKARSYYKCGKRCLNAKSYRLEREALNAK